MKTRFTVVFAMAIALPAFAHDPSLHKPGDAKDPDCAQMERMDMSKMDPQDPVVKAMHTKCMAAMKHDHDASDQAPADMKDKSRAEKPDVHSHENHEAK